MDYKKIEINGKPAYQCLGNGQGSCKRCTGNGKWNLTWTVMLFKLTPDDDAPCYCSDCIREVLK